MQHLYDEVEHRLEARSYHPTSVSNVTDPLVAEWEQISTAKLRLL